MKNIFKKIKTQKFFSKNIQICPSFIDNCRFYSASNDEQIEKRLKFLKEKGVMAKKHIIEREIKFHLLNYPSNASTNEEKEHYQKCQNRLDRILNIKGDETSDTIPSEVQTFSNFCEKIPSWNSSATSYVFHRDDARVSTKDVLCQRAQLSGLCYIHGPDMLQHYLVSMNTKLSAPMIDISKLIRDSYDAEELESHIFEDKGRSSYQMLQRILEPDSIVSSTKIEDIGMDLKQYGPLLVSGFRIYDDFYQYKSSAYHGEPKGIRKNGGTHSMIIIGARTENDKNYFLLQNWWKKMQFAEVDQIYLKKCEPILFYVETPQFKIPEKFSTDIVRYAENENLHQPDSYPETEGPLKGFDYHA